MKLSRCFLLIGLLLMAQQAFTTVLSNDFFSRAGQSRPFTFSQGFPNFGGFDFFSNLQKPTQKVQPSTAAQFNNQAQQNPQFNNQAQQNPQFNNQAQQNPQFNNQAQQNPQFNNQAQQNPQFNNQAQQNPQIIPQQNQQQFNQQAGQFVNPNQPNNFPNQNQGVLNQNQAGATNSQNLPQNLLNPVGHDSKKGSSHVDCEDEWKNEVLIFDNNRRDLCKQPRQWNGAKCVCPSNGTFLSGKCYSEVPRERTRDIFSLRFINRNFDGSENNPRHPQYGARGNPLSRLTDPNYEDGKSEILKGVPSPRVVSNTIGDIKNRIRFFNRFNDMFITWSQFVGNDITLTPTQANESLNIPIPRCDKIFDKFCTGKQQLRFSRSIYQTKRRVRTHINAVSSWLDGSNIYGSDQQTADSLREFKGGRMKVAQNNFLPKNQEGQFISGDRRVNQNVLLTALHTVFVRQHNRICNNITQRNQNLTDDEAYQIARNYVIGLIQHITFDEWLLTMFGRMTFDKYFGNYVFDPQANPSIFSEFQVAGLRVFDSYIRPSIFRFHPGAAAQIGQDNYKNVVENTQLLNTTTFPQYLSGALRNNIKTKTVELVDELRNFFITPEFPNQDTDLYSINIQRGRDHGVGSLKDIRDALGLPPKNISLAFRGQNNLECLEDLYQNPDNIDLWLALIGEEPESMTALGQIGNRIWIVQMNRIRNGDSLWYERVYPDDVIREIKATSLRTLFERHAGLSNLPQNPFIPLVQVVAYD